MKLEGMADETTLLLAINRLAKTRDRAGDERLLLMTLRHYGKQLGRPESAQPPHITRLILM